MAAVLGGVPADTEFAEEVLEESLRCFPSPNRSTCGEDDSEDDCDNPAAVLLPDVISCTQP